MKVELRAVSPDGAEAPDDERPVVDARGRIFVIKAPELASVGQRQAMAESLDGMLTPGDVGIVLPYGYSLEVYKVVEADGR